LFSNNVIYKAFYNSEKYYFEKLEKIKWKLNSLNTDGIKDNYFSNNFGNKYFSHSDAKKIDYLKKIKTFVGKNIYYFPIKDSLHTDIDDIKDFMIAEMFLKKNFFKL